MTFKDNDKKKYKFKYEVEHKIPNIWEQCRNCKKIIYYRTLADNYKVCPYCGYHFRITAKERIAMILDPNSFEKFDDQIFQVNYIEFEGYLEKIEMLQEKLDTTEAVITGEGRINGESVIICIMQSQFMMGSMGAVVGEKITLAVECANLKKLPLLIFTASGGARMQEGVISLMQMAKISGALNQFSQNNQLYISVITDPTTGGVTASFAMQGDIILSEPNALVGFAGKRVIKQTLNKDLPKEFQTSEVLLEHGFIDKIVHRKELKIVLSKILSMHGSVKYE